MSWSGGIPPYLLNIVPYTPENIVLDPTHRQVYNESSKTSFVWTPNITAGVRVQFDLYDNSLNPPQSQTLFILLGSSNRSCLPDPTASSTSALPSPQSPTSSSLQSTLSSAFPSPNPMPTVRTGLSTGAIIGIGVGAGLAGAMVIALGIWWIIRRRSRQMQSDFFDPPMSPASYASSSVVQGRPLLASTGWSGFSFSSTLASIQASNRKGVSSPEPDHVASGTSSPEPMSEAELGLRPTPYLIQRDSTTSLTHPSEHMPRKITRDVVQRTSEIVASSSDMRASTASPTQVSEADASAGSGNRPEETDGGVRLAGGPVLPGVDVADVMSDSTPPPPYSLHVHSQ